MNRATNIDNYKQLARNWRILDDSLKWQIEQCNWYTRYPDSTASFSKCKRRQISARSATAREIARVRTSHAHAQAHPASAHHIWLISELDEKFLFNASNQVRQSQLIPAWLEWAHQCSALRTS